MQDFGMTEQLSVLKNFLDPDFDADDIVIDRIRSIFSMDDAKTMITDGADFYYRMNDPTESKFVNEDSQYLDFYC